MRLVLTDTTRPAAALARDLAAEGFDVTRVADRADLSAYAAFEVCDAALVFGEALDGETVPALRRLRKTDPLLPVVVLSAVCDEEGCARLYEAGADVVLPRGTPCREVAARLRALVLRTAGHSTPRIDFGAGVLDVGARCVFVGERPLPLTRTEYRLVEILVLARGRTLNVPQIMDRLYGWENEPEPAALTVHICQIRRKFADAGASGDAIRTLRGRGYGIAATAGEAADASQTGGVALAA